MRRVHPWLVVLLVVFALPSGAHARGGAYRGPGGSVPPGLREPSDPSPPPPPPPVASPMRSGPSRTRPLRTVATSFEAWPFWYEHNRDLLETVHRSWTPAEGEKVAGPGPAKAAIAAAAAADDTQHPWVTGAALIALGKTADDPAHLDLLAQALTTPRNPVVRESAALGLGLLRRSGTEHPFDAATYDRARELLLARVEDEGTQGRLRGFAAFGLALLGDQPTAKDPTETTTRLFGVLESRPPNVDVLVGVLRALTLQPRASFSPTQIETLRSLAYEGTLADQKSPYLPRCHALSALSVLGTEEDVSHLEILLASERGTPANVRRSAAIALGILGAHAPVDVRVRILDILAETATHQRDTTTRSFALTAMIPVFAYGPPQMIGELVRRSVAPELLLATAAYGKAVERPYAALVLGWMFHGYRWSDGEEKNAFPAKTRMVLRRGVEQGPSARARAAFALALGIAGDKGSAESLRGVAADEQNDLELRGYALLGLAHLGVPNTQVMRDALVERGSDLHRMLAARSLGLAGDAGAVDLLGTEIGRGRGVTQKGETAAALARIGSPNARDALLRIATDPERPNLDRGIAIAALGRILDPEPVPSLARLTMWLNYRASTDLIDEIVSLL